MRSIIKRLALLITVGLVLGCLNAGTDFPVKPILSLTNGVTTMDQVREWFGPPYQRGIEDGKVTWTYLRVRRGFSGHTLSKELHLRFDKNQRLDSYSYTTNTDDLPQP